MVISSRKTFAFDRDELQYSFIAQLLHDWVLEMRDRDTPNGPWYYEGCPWANEEAYKDCLSRFADAFKHLAEDSPTFEGQPPWVEQALQDFAKYFIYLWRN